MLTKKKTPYIDQCMKDNEVFRKKIYLPMDKKEDLKMCTELYNMVLKNKVNKKHK